MKVSFIGGGNMASALIGGLLKKGWSADDISVVEIDAGARTRLAASFHVHTHADMASGLAAAECIVLAVKPQHVQQAAREMSPYAGNALVVSIAAGIRASDLARWLNGHGRIVRAMPNTPALVLAGVTGLYAAPGVSDADRGRAQALLSVAGKTLWVGSEEQIDAVTAVSGSGPAYVFFFIEALQEAAAALHLEPETARCLALETFAGAVKLAAESTESPATLRARVTSKGGTTERALSELEKDHVREAIVRAVSAAAARSRELGVALGHDDTAGSAPR